jgi:hypothetical protein
MFARADQGDHLFSYLTLAFSDLGFRGDWSWRLSWEWSQQVLSGVALQSDGERESQPSMGRDARVRHTSIYPDLAPQEGKDLRPIYLN